MKKEDKVKQELRLEIRKVLKQLIEGTYSKTLTDLSQETNSLLDNYMTVSITENLNEKNEDGQVKNIHTV